VSQEFIKFGPHHIQNGVQMFRIAFGLIFQNHCMNLVEVSDERL
jgi:hypothetical protein